jgi:hypothetical protein
MKIKILLCILLVLFGSGYVSAQWAASGNHIYNTNSGNVGVGNNAPATLLHVAKNMTEPTITVQNLGGTGGATYTMMDNNSGANWKFKATLSGGFKIRDQANTLDVIVIEPNSFANAIYIKSTDNIGIGTSTPHASAALEISSTSKGFLPPRMTVAEIEAIASPANGLIVFCTTDNKYYGYLSATGTWQEISFGNSGINSGFTCGTSITRNHVAGNVAPVSKITAYNTVLSNLSGAYKCWITSNLGATIEAASAIDATELAAGWYWQFNRQQGFKHDGTTRTPNSAWNTSINEYMDWHSSNDPCVILIGPGWRIPTYGEWYNVDMNGGWDNYTEAYSSVIKLHAAGQLASTNGNLTNRGSAGYYWTSTYSDQIYSWYLYISNSAGSLSTDLKTSGKTVRCIKD